MFHVRGSSDMNAKAMQVCTNLETFTHTSPLELNSKTDSQVNLSFQLNQCLGLLETNCWLRCRAFRRKVLTKAKAQGVTFTHVQLSVVRIFFYLCHDVAYEIFQVPRRAASLNSGDMFVLETPYVAYLWRGKVITLFIIQIGHCARSDWSKSHVLSEYKSQKRRVLLFFATVPLYHKANEGAVSSVLHCDKTLRTVENCGSYLISYIFLVFSNARSCFITV